MKSNNPIIRFSFLATVLASFGCSRSEDGPTDTDHGHGPGEVEFIEKGKVFHLADGILIEAEMNDRTVHYLVESADTVYALTEEGMRIELEGEVAETWTIAPPAEGYVAAWITKVPGEGPRITRFRIDDATLAKSLEELTASSSIWDIFNLKQ